MIILVTDIVAFFSHHQSALVSLIIAPAPSPGAATRPCSVSGPSPTRDSPPTAPPFASGQGPAPGDQIKFNKYCCYACSYCNFCPRLHPENTNIPSPDHASWT